MIGDIPTDFAAKDPIRPARVHQDDRQQEQRADQQERLRPRRGGGVPQRDAWRNDAGKQADRETDLTHCEQSHRGEKRRGVSPALERHP